jgi:uncharacterized protein (TIGR02757 family)
MSQSLQSALEELYTRYHKPRFMRLDPLEYVHSFTGARNREIAGLIASSLAYGKVEIIRENIQRIFSITGKDLVDFSCSTAFPRKKKLFADFKHRFNTGSDIALLFECVHKVYKENGSLEALFYKGMNSEQRNIKQPLNEFVKRMHTVQESISIHGVASFRYLLPLPQRGSACKRLNMYLRWMVRPNDGIDLGIWRAVETSKLVIPVDTHVAAIARRLGLTRRKTVDWRMAEEITHQLQKINPSDPVKYDFSLCRWGMVDFRRK